MFIYRYLFIYPHSGFLFIVICLSVFVACSPSPHPQEHILVVGVLTVVRLSAEFLHLSHQAPVAHDLEQAGLQRDAQPEGKRDN